MKLREPREWINGIATEWSKITWPGRAQLARKVAVTTFVSVVLGTLIALADSGFQALVNLVSGLF